MIAWARGTSQEEPQFDNFVLGSHLGNLLGLGEVTDDDSVNTNLFGEVVMHGAVGVADIDRQWEVGAGLLESDNKVRAHETRGTEKED